MPTRVMDYRRDKEQGVDIFCFLFIKNAPKAECQTDKILAS